MTNNIFNKIEHRTLAGRNYEFIRFMRKKNLLKMFEYADEKPHKMNEIATIRGIKFIDDSASICVNSTWYALESISENIIWIMGDENGDKVKSEDLSTLIPSVINKVRVIINIGNDNNIKPFAGLVSSIIKVFNIKDAVSVAYQYASANETVLFSPTTGKNSEQIETNATMFKRAVNDL